MSKDLINQKSTYLIVHIFTVNLGLDNVHERVDQSRALPELPPRLTSLWTHISLIEKKVKEEKQERRLEEVKGERKESAIATTKGFQHIMPEHTPIKFEWNSC